MGSRAGRSCAAGRPGPRTAPFRADSGGPGFRPPGASRRYTCDEGHQLVGKAHSFCGEDLRWSPAAPTCVEQVTCSFFVDNKVYSVFVDGVRTPVRRVLGSDHKSGELTYSLERF